MSSTITASTQTTESPKVNHSARESGLASVQGQGVPMAVSRVGPSVGLPWLMHLRWWMVVGQVAMLGLAQFAFKEPFSWGMLYALAFTGAASNGLLQVCLKHSMALNRWKHSVLIAAILVLDILLLTGMLAFSGGPTNPFSVFFVVHVSLATLLLPPAMAWGMTVLTILAFGAMFLLPVPVALDHHASHGSSSWSLHLIGMWVAYALAAGMVAYFATRISAAIRQRDLELAHARRLAEQHEQLAVFSSFSANAAHELGTPLGTIGLAARELHRQSPEAWATDLDLICDEVVRCKKILADIACRAGQSVGEMPRCCTPAEIARAVSDTLQKHNLHIVWDNHETQQHSVFLPVDATVRALVNLIRNASEANEDANRNEPVSLRVSLDTQLHFDVLDRGNGFAPHVAGRVGEPFVTTKSERGGLGLGVYLVQSFAERIGGRLRYSSRSDGGLCARLSLSCVMMEEAEVSRG